MDRGGEECCGGVGGAVEGVRRPWKPSSCAEKGGCFLCALFRPALLVFLVFSSFRSLVGLVCLLQSAFPAHIGSGDGRVYTLD